MRRVVATEFMLKSFFLGLFFGSHPVVPRNYSRQCLENHVVLGMESGSLTHKI